jgi:hypothetical protein
VVQPGPRIIVAFWVVAIVSTAGAFAISMISRVSLAVHFAIGPMPIGPMPIGPALLLPTRLGVRRARDSVRRGGRNATAHGP